MAFTMSFSFRIGMADNPFCGNCGSGEILQLVFCDCPRCNGQRQSLAVALARLDNVVLRSHCGWSFYICHSEILVKIKGAFRHRWLFCSVVRDNAKKFRRGWLKPGRPPTRLATPLGSPINGLLHKIIKLIEDFGAYTLLSAVVNWLVPQSVCMIHYFLRLTTIVKLRSGACRKKGRLCVFAVRGSLRCLFLYISACALGCVCARHILRLFLGACKHILLLASADLCTALRRD